MTLGDVMPALQQGAIDGAIAGLPVFTAFHYQDAAKYITETNMSSIFLVIEVSKKGTTRCLRICSRSSTRMVQPWP